MFVFLHVYFLTPTKNSCTVMSKLHYRQRYYRLLLQPVGMFSNYLLCYQWKRTATMSQIASSAAFCRGYLGTTSAVENERGASVVQCCYLSGCCRTNCKWHRSILPVDCLLIPGGRGSAATTPFNIGFSPTLPACLLQPQCLFQFTP